MGDDDFDPDNRSQTLRRQLVNEFFTEMQASRLIVECTKVSQEFDLTIGMRGGWTLEAFSCSRSNSDAWRILSEAPNDSLIADGGRWEIWTQESSLTDSGEATR